METYADKNVRKTKGDSCLPDMGGGTKKLSGAPGQIGTTEKANVKEADG